MVKKHRQNDDTYDTRLNLFFAIDLGTTWTQEMVWCIMNNLDFKAAKESILEKRVPYFEYFVVIFNNVHKLEETRPKYIYFILMI